MAIIRCPACGKPNPDFLDVCQYCETTLIGGGQPGGPPAGEPSPAAAALKAAADETIIGGSAQTIRCQACGRSNPAHLDNCQYCQARLKPMVAGTSSSAAATPASALADPPVSAEPAEPSVNLLNRLRTMGTITNPPAETEPEPEPEELVEPSPANWMSRLRGMTDSAETASAMDAAPVEPDWMWTGQQPDEAAAAPPPTEVSPGSDELPDWLRDPDAPTLPGTGQTPAGKPRRKMTDWLNARPGNAPVEPPPVEDVPDWLKNLAGSSSGPGTPAVSGPLPDLDAPPARPASSPPPSGTSDLPDWLKTIRTSTPLGGAPEEDPNTQASSAHRMQALPEWMRTGTFADSDPLPDPEPEPEPPAPQSDIPAEPGLLEPPTIRLIGQVDPPLTEAESEDMPTWLRAIITPGAADETIPVPAKPKKKKMTDWLGNAPPPTEAPTSDSELPDWLKALSAGGSAPPPAAPANSPVAEGLPAWLQSADAMEPDPASPVSFDRPSAAPAAANLPPSTPPASAPPAPADDFPDWLRSIGAASAEPTPPVVPAMPVAPPAPKFDAEATIVPPTRTLTMPGAAKLTSTMPPAAPSAPVEADLPDWLTALSASAAGPAEPDTVSAVNAAAPADLDHDTLAWLNTLGSEPGPPVGTGLAPVQTAATVMPVASEDTLDLSNVALPAEAPAWLDELAAAAQVPSAPAPISAAPDIQPTPETELPEWLKTMRGLPTDLETPAEELPDWLRAMRGLPPMAIKERQERAAETAAVLQEQADTAPSLSDPEATMIGQRPAVTNATETNALPAWLAAMRPVDIAQASAGEADSYEETLGVLAGMRGVLRAEPSIALPHKAIPAINRLAVSDQHSAQVRLLTELQQSEAAAAPRKSSVARVAQTIERWIVFAVLAVAIILAQFQLPAFFGGPRLTPEANAAYSQMLAAGAQSPAAGTLPRPALVVFDYEAAQQGELNPAAAAILRQLMGEGVPVVGVSTRASGAAVGQMLLADAAQMLHAETNFDYVYGTHYLNLGYIPGGPIGLLQFAFDPHSVFYSDFTDAYSVDNNVWNAPAVQLIGQLEDFSLIVLISGTPQATSAWVEQAQVNALNVPVIAVVSASAEPLVRPYLTALSEPTNLNALPNPQLDGLIVGLGGGAALEQQMGRPGDALATWPALGGGLLAAALLIAVGGLVFGLLSLIRRRS